jgi:protein associated with RNAse G/E
MKRIIPGTYVLATKYSDGDPWDPWAIGFIFKAKDDCIILDNDAEIIFRANTSKARFQKITPREANYIFKIHEQYNLNSGVHPQSDSLWKLLREYRKKRKGK